MEIPFNMRYEIYIEMTIKDKSMATGSYHHIWDIQRAYRAKLLCATRQLQQDFTTAEKSEKTWQIGFNLSMWLKFGLF